MPRVCEALSSVLSTVTSKQQQQNCNNYRNSMFHLKYPTMRKNRVRANIQRHCHTCGWDVVCLHSTAADSRHFCSLLWPGLTALPTPVSGTWINRQRETRQALELPLLQPRSPSIPHPYQESKEFYFSHHPVTESNRFGKIQNIFCWQL